MRNKLWEVVREKLWLLAVLSGTLEPFGVKIVCGRKFSRTGLPPERWVPLGLRTLQPALGSFLMGVCCTQKVNHVDFF